MGIQIPIDEHQIADFCRRYHIRKLVLIGSVLLRRVCDAAEKIGKYVTEGRERFLGESQGSLDRR